MTKQEIQELKDELKKLLDAEVWYCQEQIGYTQSEYERGFEEGIKHVSDNVIDKWAEGLED